MVHGPTVTVCSSRNAAADVANDPARAIATPRRIVPSLVLPGAPCRGGFTASLLITGRGRGSGASPACLNPGGTRAAAAAAFLATSAVVSAGSRTSHWQIL